MSKKKNQKTIVRGFADNTLVLKSKLPTSETIRSNDVKFFQFFLKNWFDLFLFGFFFKIVYIGSR